MKISSIQIETAKPFTSQTICEEAYDTFSAEKDLRTLPVVDSQNFPIGIVNRSDLLTTLAQRFGRALYESKPITTVMNKHPVTVSLDDRLETLMDIMGAEKDVVSLEGFIITDKDGRYHGVSDGLHLIRAMQTVDASRAKAFQRQAKQLEHVNGHLAREVSDRKAAEHKAYELANSDPLTGLANRRRFLNDAQQIIDQHNQATVIFIDLDRFKAINDRYSHLFGDEVLRKVAERISRFQETGTVARLGGDEFALVLPGNIPPALARKFTDKIRSTILKPVIIEGKTVSVGASLGVCTYPDDGADLSAILMGADLAMFRAKRNGGGVCRFDADLDRHESKNSEIEAKLAVDITRWAIVPAFQPVLSLNTNTVDGYEALARWPSGTADTIGPDVFIPMAERLGLIDQLFWSVLAAACKNIAQTRETVRLAVNASPLQFADPDFVDKLLTFIARRDFPAERLEIEITESAMIADRPATIQALHQLTDNGISIALDDFGTGHSSLSLLQSLPLSKVKIDRTFVRNMYEDRQNASIVKSILSLCQSLQLETCAEGVEDQRTLDLLSAHGCTLVQGYFIGKPEAVPLELQPSARTSPWLGGYVAAS